MVYPNLPNAVLVVFDPAAYLATALGPTNTKIEELMSTIADLTAAVNTEDTKVEAFIAAYNAAKANPATTLAPADQAALDAAVTALGATGADVDVANPPVVTP